MKPSRSTSAVLVMAVAVALSGCAFSASDAVSPPAAVDVETPTPTPTTEPAASNYPACPAGLVDALRAASSPGGSPWVEVAFEAAAVPGSLQAPVPSCVLQRGDWSRSFYVGAGQELFDTIASSVVGLGIADYVPDMVPPGSRTWGTEDTGFVTLTLITPGDQSTIVGPIFTEPSLELEVQGTPIQ